LETGSDGVARQWTAQKANLPPFFAIALTKPNPKFARNSGAIRYVVPSNRDIPVFDKFPIESFADPATADMLASFIKDKYVLIGGDFVDRDRFETPIGSLSDDQSEDGKMIGLEVHAHMLAQLLNDDLPAPIPGWTLWIAAFIVTICGGLSALVIAKAIKVVREYCSFSFCFFWFSRFCCRISVWTLSLFLLLVGGLAGCLDTSRSDRQRAQSIPNSAPLPKALSVNIYQNR